MRKPGDTGGLPSMKTTGQQRMMPPTKSNLENHFQESFMSYSETEIDQILKRYQTDLNYISENIRPILTNIVTILTATKILLSHTTLDGFFKKLREQAPDDSGSTKTLDDIQQALLNAQSQLKNKDKNAGFQLTFAQAVDYCKNCIRNRIAELKSADDKIYVVYQKHNLKNIFETKAYLPRK